METFLDIKKALEKVPDKILENLHFATGEGSEETIGLTCYDEGEEDYEFPKIFDLVDKKYPELNTFAKLVKNVGKAQEKLDEQEDDDFYEKMQEDGVTSETFKDDAKK